VIKLSDRAEPPFHSAEACQGNHYRLMVRSNQNPACQPVYDAIGRFIDVALKADGSLFDPDRSVWSSPVIEDLRARFNLAPDESSDKFEKKFERQLAGAPAATVQLAAEVLFVHFLVASDIGASAKQRVVDLVRSWSPEPILIPDSLMPAFSAGICHSGVAFNTRRPNQLWFLIDFMRAWKQLDPAVRDHLLKDAWAFKDFAESVPQKAASTQLQGLLHLVFPTAFESMVSRDHKKLIIQSFASDVTDPLPADPDQALAKIRAYLEPEYGREFSFYDSPIAERWRPAKPPAKSRSGSRSQSNPPGGGDDKPGLLFRVYVPSGRLYASEADKMLSLFRDWVSGVRGRWQSVRVLW
jgi:5-methylcytosine-specific restriction protein B